MRILRESGKRLRRGALACLALLALIAGAQSPGTPRHDVQSGLQTRELSPARPNPAGGGLRAIRDVHTGTRWVIVRNPHNPAGPGLVITANDSDGPSSNPATRRNAASFVIHAGDSLLIEEHSAAADSYLEGVALEGAELGATLGARLKLGGKVVKVTAMERGRASFIPREKGQP